MEKARNRVIVGVLLAVALVICSVLPAAAVQPAAKAALIDINSASQKDLESLPGVGPATAKKIIAGRPYATVADLAKAGVSAKTIDKITPLITVGAAVAPAVVSPATTKPPKGAASTAGAVTAASSATLLDLNTASEKDLESLPGVGPATAEKIIAGRPYTTVADLAKAGVSAKTIDKITPLVTVGKLAAVTTPAAPATAPPPVSSAQPATGASAAAVTTAQTPPVAGMVWVNLSTKVYHYQGDEWYGKTKSGKFMTEQDAIAAGYHASKAKLKAQ